MAVKSSMNLEASKTLQHDTTTRLIKLVPVINDWRRRRTISIHLIFILTHVPPSEPELFR